MNNLFIGYYVALLLKGKNKWMEVLISILFMVLFALLFGQNLANFLVGRQIKLLELLSLPLIIYAVLNFLYTLFHGQVTIAKSEKPIATLPVSTIRVSPKIETVGSQESEMEILGTKNYARDQSVRSKPKGLKPIKKQSQTAARALNKEKPEKEAETDTAPPLEVNFESATGLIEDESEALTNEYSGVVDENFEMPEEKTTPFNKTQKKKFL